MSDTRIAEASQNRAFPYGTSAKPARVAPRAVLEKTQVLKKINVQNISLYAC